MEKPRLDESRAAAYIGKTVLIGITYLDHEQKLIEQRQWVGRIITFSNTKGIQIKVEDSDVPLALPPDPRGIHKARPGVYKLRSTGQEVINPEYVATWTSVKPRP